MDVENKETVQYEGCSRVWSTIDLHVLDWWKVNDEHGSHRREFLQTVLESKTPAYAFAAHLKKSKYIYILLIICTILLCHFLGRCYIYFFLPCNDVAGILMDFAISRPVHLFPKALAQSMVWRFTLQIFTKQRDDIRPLEVKSVGFPGFPPVKLFVGAKWRTSLDPENTEKLWVFIFGLWLLCK